MPAMERWMTQRVRRATLVVGSGLAVLLGLWLAPHLPVVQGWWILLGLPGAVLLAQHSRLTLCWLVCLCGLIGVVRGCEYSERLAVTQALAYHKVVLVGVAAEDATYSHHSQLAFTADNVQVVGPTAIKLEGTYTISGYGETSIYRGDIVQIKGKLYPTRGNNIASVGFADLQVLKRGDAPIDAMRRTFAAGMQSALPEPTASFGLGLLIGQRSTLPDDVALQLQQAGLTHIIAVSGYNLTIIVEVVRRLCAKRSKFQTIAVCFTLMLVFILVTGSSPPIIRASMISVLSLTAWYYGRTIQPLALLITAAALSAYVQPLYVWGNVSWYLSFLAFFGVLLVAPLVIRRWCKKQPGLIGKVFIESTCATLLTTPFLLYTFGQISIVAVLANIAVAVFVPLAMGLSVLAGLCGVCWPELSGWAAWPARLLLTYMLDMAALIGRLPHAFITGIAFSLPHMVVAYGLLAGFCGALWFRTQKNGIITDEEDLPQKELVYVGTFQMVDHQTGKRR